MRGLGSLHKNRACSKAFFVFMGRFFGVRTGIETGKIARAEGV